MKSDTLVEVYLREGCPDLDIPQQFSSDEEAAEFWYSDKIRRYNLTAALIKDSYRYWQSLRNKHNRYALYDISERDEILFALKAYEGGIPDLTKYPPKNIPDIVDFHDMFSTIGRSLSFCLANRIWICADEENEGKPYEELSPIAQIHHNMWKYARVFNKYILKGTGEYNLLYDHINRGIQTAMTAIVGLAEVTPKVLESNGITPNPRKCMRTFQNSKVLIRRLASVHLDVILATLNSLSNDLSQGEIPFDPEAFELKAAPIPFTYYIDIDPTHMRKVENQLQKRITYPGTDNNPRLGCPAGHKPKVLDVLEQRSSVIDGVFKAVSYILRRRNFFLRG